jgi:cytochrome c oxidase cbb3-type subunit 4
MDFSIIHSVFTIMVLVIFVGIVLWAYDSRSKPRFDAAARIPLDDDDAPGAHATSDKEKNNA